MKKNFFAFLIAASIIILAVNPMVISGYETGDMVGEFELFTRYDEPAPGEYTYNLNDYFEKGEIKFVAYEIESGPWGNAVTLDGNILVVRADGDFEETVKIKATDRNGDSVYAVLNIKVANSHEYVINRIKTILWILAAIFILLLLVFFAPGIKGDIQIENHSGEKSESLSGHWWNILWRSIPSKWGVRGIFVGMDECVKFIPLPGKGRNIYITKDINDRERNIIKINSYPLYPGKTVCFYNSVTCSESSEIRITFNKK